MSTPAHRSRSVRAALVDAAAAHVATLTEGRDDREVPAVARDRLYLLQAGAEVVVPGWMAGPVIGARVAERASAYRLVGDLLDAVRVSPHCTARDPDRCQRDHQHWQPAAA